MLNSTPTLCAACGFDNPPGMRFCGNCGARLAESIQPTGSEQSSQITDALGRVLMGPNLLERFRQAGLEARGQRRSVTVLFADLSGYTSLSQEIDSEDLFELVQRFIPLLSEAVYKYEGMVDKIIGDGLMALFGAPISHENNAERALRAALDMQESVTALSKELIGRIDFELKLHVGLHSGSVIVGGVGSNMLMDYTAIGDTVNLANRLEQVAEGGTVLASEAVYRATRAIFDFEAIPDLSLKGIRQPVDAYRLRGLKAAPESVRGIKGLRAPLVGRELEFERLKEATAGLIDRKQGCLALVTGEAGIGKTRLTAELKAYVAPFHLLILEGQSLTYRRSVSYWIFLDLLRNLFGISPETPGNQALHQVHSITRELVGDRAGEIFPYLDHLLGLEPLYSSGVQRFEYLDASQLRQQTFIAVRELLVAQARLRPLILILEDLHWADEASLDLLSFLVDTVRREPMMIYTITRPTRGGPLEAIMDQARKWPAGWFIEIPLKSLSAEHSERLLYELLAIPDLPENLHRLILQRAAGIPFYLEEILRMLIDERVIQQVEGNWRLVPGAQTSTLGVPGNLQELILARIDRLDPSLRKVLQIASVIGRQFSLPLLAEILPPEGRAELRTQIIQLVEKAFLLPPADSQATEYLFRHVLTSDAVYSTLLRRDREELHGRVGEAIERLYADRLEGQIEVLAGHFLRSKHLDRALHYLTLAGQRAGRDYANLQAKKHYVEALKLLPKVTHSPGQAIQVREGLGDALVFTGEYQEAREQYQEALQILQNAGDKRFGQGFSALQRKIGTTYERQGAFDQALQHLAEAANSLDGLAEPLPEERAAILNETGWIHFLRGSFEEAHNFLSSAIRLVESSPKFDVIASIYNRLGAVAYQQRKYGQAAEHVRRSLELRETIGDLAGVARLFNNLGLINLIQGNLSEAETNFRQSTDRLERIGDAEGITLSYINLGLVQLDRGDLSAADENLRMGSTSAEQIGHRFYHGLALMYLGRLQTNRGLVEDAERNLRKSLTIFRGLGAQDHLIDTYYYLGENSFVQDDLSGAKEWARQANRLLDNLNQEEKSVSIQRGRVLRLEGAIARKKGEVENAEKLLRESAEIFNTSFERLEWARTAHEQGLLEISKEDIHTARDIFRQARAIFAQIGATLDLARIEQAQLLAG
jgi:predicted ATPase/class 3 adenylate cyclase